MLLKCSKVNKKPYFNFYSLFFSFINNTNKLYAFIRSLALYKVS